MKFQVKPCRQPAGSPPSARSLERQPSKSNQATTARFFVNQENALTLSVLLGPKGRPCRGLPSPAALLSLLPSLSVSHNTTKASSTRLPPRNLKLLLLHTSLWGAAQEKLKRAKKRTHLCLVPGHPPARDLKPLGASTFSHVKQELEFQQQ